jgi:hypothetical protein
MTHFIAKSDTKKPNAAQAAQLRKSLKAIDPDLSLVVDGTRGAAACWVAGPDYYGASHYAAKRADAVAAFSAVMS